MISYAKLYKRDTKGKVRVWYIEQEADHYRMVSGLIDGQHVASGWTVCEGKNIGKSNETTPEEQATAEATALYTKKRDKGYFDNITHIDNPTLYKPMLANKYEGGLNFKKGIFSQPKLDGARCIADSKGLWTRNGKKYVSVPHIWNELKPLFEENPDLILDGELYNHELHDDFNTIMSLVKQLKPTLGDLQKSEKMVQYHVYDIPSSDGTFKERNDSLRELFVFHNERLKYLKKVETIEIKNETELDLEYGKLLAEGYEGQMVRLNEPYENKRSKFLLKRKEFQDIEAEIVEIKEGIGNWAGYAKIVAIKVGDNVVGSGLRGSQEFTKQLLKEKDQYVGGTATIRFQNYTPDGVPRFPVAVAFYKGKRDL